MSLNDGEIMKNKDKANGRLGLVTNVFFITLTFIFLLYFVSCFLISFRQNFLKVIISCVNISIIAIYKTSIEKYVGNRAAYLLTAVSIAIVMIIIYTFGYFEVSTTITKF